MYCNKREINGCLHLLHHLRKIRITSLEPIICFSFLYNIISFYTVLLVESTTKEYTITKTITKNIY